MFVGSILPVVSFTENSTIPTIRDGQRRCLDRTIECIPFTSYV